MKKILLFVLTLVALSVLGSSCSKTKTAQERLKDERKAIDRFITQKGFKIIDEYPEDGIFEENTYLKTSDGLYIHVIDSGNGVKPIQNQTILVRYEGRLLFKDDTTKYSNTGTGVGAQPDEFNYGTQGYTGYTCAGMAIPFTYDRIGHNAEVSLIIPSPIGARYPSGYSDFDNFRPVFYERIIYRLD